MIDKTKLKESQKEIDPLYEILVKCPVCNKENIPRYDLRAKTQQITQNTFLIPKYKGISPYKTCDYTMVAVTVCPRCLFASPDKKDFHSVDISGQKEIKSQLSGNIITTLQEKAIERKKILNSDCDTQLYFGKERTPQAAIDSYQLAILRAKVESWYDLPYSLYKMGAYSLRIARLIKVYTSLENSNILLNSLKYFEDAFKNSNCPSEEIEMQVIYLIIALSLKMKDEKKASSYMNVFTNLRNAKIAEQKKNPQISTTIIDKWYEKARFLWEERDNPDIFNEE